MIRTIFLALAILHLVAAPARAQTPTGSPDRIAYDEAEPFGSYRISWEINAFGTGWVRTSRRDQSELTTTEDHFSVGAAEFRRLSAVLEPLEKAGNCMPDIDDDVGAAVTWTRQSRDSRAMFYLSCPVVGREAWARGQEATSIVKQWTKGS